MSKYYTPSLEEFHIGFRFELIETSPTQTVINNSNPSSLKPFEYIEEGVTWAECTYLKHESNRCNLSQSLLGKDGIENNLHLFRVKYLDQQHIEELGWTLNKNYHICEQEYSINIDDYSWYELNLSCGWDESIKDIEIEKFTIDGKLVGSLTHSKTLFKGKIRNYNELKLIMSMVGIK